MKIKSQIKIIIFDMDGTLYSQDGENGTFKNSSLNKTVIENSVEFFMKMEKCKREKAEALVQEALVTDTIGISNFASKRFGISRAQFFDIVWNIEPAKIIKDFRTQKKVLKILTAKKRRMFLLTGAPRIWMENATNFLGISGIFERKYHGEMFGLKNEIFETLSKDFDPKSILSVGDQFETDLKPAQELGMQIFQVAKPKDLLKLI